VIALLLELQRGYAKYCCLLCEWDSRDTKIYYIEKQWPKTDSLIRGKNVLNNTLVNPGKLFLPSFHIKLGIMKKIVKAMDTIVAGFMYLKHTFPRLSDAKIKEELCVGHQIR
jgi:hypothetical protein